MSFTDWQVSKAKKKWLNIQNKSERNRCFNSETKYVKYRLTIFAAIFDFALPSKRLTKVSIQSSLFIFHTITKNCDISAIRPNSIHLIQCKDHPLKFVYLAGIVLSHQTFTCTYQILGTVSYFGTCTYQIMSGGLMEAEVENVVKRWLRGAGDHACGRNKRQQKKRYFEKF